MESSQLSPHYDRTWSLTIQIDFPEAKEKLQEAKIEEFDLRVRGDYTIGRVMSMIGEYIINTIGSHYDWSDHAIWRDDKKRWLKQSRMTLDQVEVYAHTILQFTSMHKPLKIQFPDLQIHEFNVDFSVSVLNSVSKLCQELNISHPEELSFLRPLSKKHLKRNTPSFDGSQSLDPNKILSKTLSNGSMNGYSDDTLDRSTMGSYRTVSNGTISHNTLSSTNSISGSTGSLPSYDSIRLIPKPKTVVEKARLNSAWLNSSLSLYEQNVKENDILLLNFKYFTFYGLNIDELARVNYAYEQLKGAILNEELNCTDDDMYTLAGIMLRVHQFANCKSPSKMNGNGLQSNGSPYLHPDYIPQHNGMNGHGEYLNDHQLNNNNHRYALNNNIKYMNGKESSGSELSLDPINEELEKLEISLNQTSNGNHNYSNGVDLMITDKLRVSYRRIKDNSSTLRKFLKSIPSDRYHHVSLDGTTLSVYKSIGDGFELPQLFELNLSKCEVTPNVSVSSQKYSFNILESNAKELFECNIKCQDQEQYAKWYSACKVASMGKTSGDSFKEHQTNTLNLLKYHSKLATQSQNFKRKELKNVDWNVAHFVSPKFLKKKGKEQSIAKVKAAADLKHYKTVVEAQMDFIKTCQNLKDFGITFFVIRFNHTKKEDLLGVKSDKLVLVDINNGTLKKSWRYNRMKDWNINWEIKQMAINLEDETLEFECLSADCKVIHEFIGGYIYLSLRKGENPQFDEVQFLKLAGGWNDDERFDVEDEHIAMCRHEAFVNHQWRR